jgi:polysaccharide export outer membrane protein
MKVRKMNKSRRNWIWILSVALLLATSLNIFALEAGLPDLGKILQSLPDLRNKPPATRKTGEAKRLGTEARTPATPTGDTTAAVPEKTDLTKPMLEKLIQESGILPPEELKVFGQQLFSAGPTSFSPPTNIPVTLDYIVGPDDDIVVNVWGRLNETYILTVQRNGSVYVPQVGSMNVAGQTYKQVVAAIRKEVESVLGVSASVTMGELRSITVFVVGAVKQPGAYTVSAFDTILNALIYAGGPEAKSLLDDWYREKLKNENADVLQLVERLRKERERISDRELNEAGLKAKLPQFPDSAAQSPDGTAKFLGGAAQSLDVAAQSLGGAAQSLGGVAQSLGGTAKSSGGTGQTPDVAAKYSGGDTGKDKGSVLKQLLSIFQAERQSEDVIKRVRELDGEQLQKELEDLETVEKNRDKYTSLRQLIGKIKLDKELAEKMKDYAKHDVRYLEDELRKLDSSRDMVERDYTLKQHVFAEKRYKEAQAEKETLLPVQLGSMRNIQLKRNDKVISVFDLYDLILNGDKSKDLRLQQGDVIFVPKPEATVAIYGDVKVPALYELKQEQSLLKILELAGGLKTSAFGGQIQVQRYANNQERVVLDTSLAALKDRKDSFVLQDGDRVKVFRVVEEDVNVVYLYGHVKRPGKYQFQPGSTVSMMIMERDLQPNTNLSYAFVKRYKKPAMEPTIVPFKLGEAILQKAPGEDLALQPYDEIYIFRQWDFQSRPDITVSGEVRNPGKYPLQKNMRVKDALFMAGGPNAYASLDSAHIFRTNPESRGVIMLIVDIARALAEREQDNVVLQDKDRLVIHHIQESIPEKFVTIEGEVSRTGQYPLTEGMTVRDLLFAAGNIKESAYLDEAELTSMITDGGQNTKYVNRNLSLRKAFAGDAGQNAPLRPYDRLLVKQIPDWRSEKFVKVEGEVRFPGTYAVRKGEKLSSLIERAGGYKETAYLRGTMFTRERVRDLQQKSILAMADRLERELLSGDSGVSTAISAEEVAGKKVEMEQKQKMVESLRKVKATGRMTIYMAHLRLLKGSEYDIELEDRDTLFLPQKNSVVNVAGAVMTQGSYIYADRLGYTDYIEQTGGYTAFADTGNVFVLKVDGSARKMARGFFNWSSSQNRWEIAGAGEEIKDIEPGDTIVVPEKIERIAWMRNIRDITQILMNTAVSAGVLITLF